MIVHPSDIPKAEKFARDQRFAGAKLLVVDETKICSDEARGLVEKVKAAVAKDPKEYDAAISQPKVAVLFSMGVLHFGGNS